MSLAAGLIEEVIGTMFGVVGGKWMAGTMGAGANEAIQKFMERLKVNPRAALAVTLLDLDRSERERIMQALRDHSKTHSENAFVAAIGELLAKRSDGSVDEERARRVFTKFNALDATDMDVFEDLLIHDPIWEFVESIRDALKSPQLRAAGEKILEIAAYGAGRTVRVAERINEAANTAAPHLEPVKDGLRRLIERLDQIGR